MGEHDRRRRRLRLRWLVTFAGVAVIAGDARRGVVVALGAELATAAGLDRGAYHFFTRCAPGAIQARNFLSVAPPEPDASPPALDLELAGNGGARPTPAPQRALGSPGGRSRHHAVTGLTPVL